MGERGAYVWALKVTLIFSALLAVVAVGLAAWLGGASSALAAGLGVAITMVAAVATQWSMLRAYRQDPVWMAATVGFVWLGKMLVVVIALALLSQVENFERIPFGLAAVAGVLGPAVIDMLAMKRARVPSVEPSSNESQK